MRWTVPWALALCLAGCGDDAPIVDAAVPLDAPLPPAPACREPHEVTGCERDADCAPDACLADLASTSGDLTPLVRSCGVPGGGALQGEACAVPSDCARNLCVIAGTCATPCSGDADCPAETVCRDVWARAESNVHHPTRACVAAAVLPPDVGYTARRLSVETSGDVELPAVAGSTLHVIEPPCGQSARVERLVAALDGRELFSIERLSDTTPAINPVAAGLRPTTVLLPSGDATAVDSQAHYRVGAAGDVTLHTLSRDATATRLDIDVFYAGGGGWVPAGPRGPDELALALAFVDRVLAPGGVRLGEVRQHAVFGGLRDELSVIERGEDGTRPQLEVLFSLAAGVASPSVSLFLVRTVEGPLLGFSSGIPGPWGLPAGGVTLSIDLLDGPMLERALAHELLHYLGLFHTTEATGVLLEGLADTPACDPERDLDGDRLVSADECAGAGADNLMFWAASGEQLSPTQRVIVGRAMVLVAD